MTATRSLVIEKKLPHKPEKIWRALTQGDLVKEWLMDNDFAPSIGHEFNFRSAPMHGWDGIIRCEVLAVEPYSTLSYSWGALGLESVIVWTLVEIEGGTLLRMEQSGFRADQDAAYQGATYGWQKFIGNLERVVTQMQ